MPQTLTVNPAALSYDAPELVRVAATIMREAHRDGADVLADPATLSPVQYGARGAYRMTLACIAGYMDMTGPDLVGALVVVVAAWADGHNADGSRLSAGLSPRAAEAVAFESDAMASWESRRPTGAEVAEAARQVVEDANPGSLTTDNDAEYEVAAWDVSYSAPTRGKGR
jgi:hypothetical protein